MKDEERDRRIGARIALARREAGLTQHAFAKKLGITTRSVQNHEAGVFIPYRHLPRIESITGKRPGWILDDTGGHEDGDVRGTLEALQSAIDEHYEHLLNQLAVLRSQMQRRRDQREASVRRRERGTTD